MAAKKATVQMHKGRISRNAQKYLCFFFQKNSIFFSFFYEGRLQEEPCWRLECTQTPTTHVIRQLMSTFLHSRGSGVNFSGSLHRRFLGR